MMINNWGDRFKKFWKLKYHGDINLKKKIIWIATPLSFNKHDHKVATLQKAKSSTSTCFVLLCLSDSFNSTVISVNSCTEKSKDGWFQGGDDLKTSSMENRQLWTLLFQKIRPFQGRNLELVITPSLVTWDVNLCKCYWVFCWWMMFWRLVYRHLSIEKNRYIYIRLYPEPSRVSKEQPPLARFIFRVSISGANRKHYISPSMPYLTNYVHIFLLKQMFSLLIWVVCGWDVHFYEPFFWRISLFRYKIKNYI